MTLAAPEPPFPSHDDFGAVVNETDGARGAGNLGIADEILGTYPSCAGAGRAHPEPTAVFGVCFEQVR